MTVRGGLLLLALAAGACSSPQPHARPTPVPQASAPHADPQTARLLAQAQGAVDEAKKASPGWNEADATLQDARAAAARGSDRRAQNLADDVLTRAAFVLDAHYLALAQLEMQKAQTYTGLTDAQIAQVHLAELALARNDGRKAYAILAPLNRQLAEITKKYVVAAGDSLWIISGREDVYGNSWLWPLIWQANLSTLRDPNRLLVGQKLKIRPNPTIAEVVKAVEFAHDNAGRSVHIGEIREAGR